MSTTTVLPLSLSSTDEEETKTIHITAKDKKQFLIQRKYALISTLIKTSLENDETATDIPVPGVLGPILDLIHQYMEHHKGVEPGIIEKPLRSREMKAVCSDKWDAEYIDKIGGDRQQLYDLILGANYLDVKSLLHLGCAKVASLIKGQPLEKIKEILDPKSNLNTPSSSSSTQEEKKKEHKEEKHDRTMSSNTNSNQEKHDRNETSSGSNTTSNSSSKEEKKQQQMIVD